MYKLCILTWSVIYSLIMMMIRDNVCLMDQVIGSACNTQSRLRKLGKKKHISTTKC